MNKGGSALLNNLEAQMKEIREIIVKEKGENYYSDMLKRLEENQQKMFMDGYVYAIRVLENGLLNSDK